MEPQDNFLESCLFFNANTLSRYLLKLAEKEFNPLKLSPAHASLLLVVYDEPGIGPKELAGRLHLTPSTITRFVDALEKKKLVRRKSKGKMSMISPTPKGLELKREVALAYKRMVLKFNEILGEAQAASLSSAILSANKKLAGFLDEN